jgi:hypothetical protein
VVGASLRCEHAITPATGAFDLAVRPSLEKQVGAALLISAVCSIEITYGLHDE